MYTTHKGKRDAHSLDFSIGEGRKKLPMQGK